jgi:type II secretory pathway predicted ATPase ExeA
MFDSTSQREAWHALRMWLEVKGIGLLTASTGMGKSITVRRFCSDLDEARYRVWRFGQAPMTPNGFLRSLSRVLELPVRRHTADLFDAVRTHLLTFAETHGLHPVLVLDDGEGMRADCLDLLRRLTAWDLDAEDRLSVLLVGTEDLLATLRRADLASLRSRLTYARQLRPFSLEDTRNYVRHQLRQAGSAGEVLSDEAVRELYAVAQGAPRATNQVALQAMIQAAVEGIDRIDARFLQGVIAAHPLLSRGDR